MAEQSLEALHENHGQGGRSGFCLDVQAQGFLEPVFVGEADVDMKRGHGTDVFVSRALLDFGAQRECFVATSEFGENKP